MTEGLAKIAMKKKYIEAWVAAAHPIINKNSERNFSVDIVLAFIKSTLDLDVYRGALIDDTNLEQNVTDIVAGIDRKVDSEFTVIRLFAQAFKDTLPDVIEQTLRQNFIVDQSNFTIQTQQCRSVHGLK